VLSELMQDAVRCVGNEKILNERCVRRGLPFALRRQIADARLLEGRSFRGEDLVLSVVSRGLEVSLVPLFTTARLVPTFPVCRSACALFDTLPRLVSLAYRRFT
jgi:hypothetical protein